MTLPVAVILKKMRMKKVFQNGCAYWSVFQSSLNHSILLGFDSAEAFSALSNSSLTPRPLLAFHNLQFAHGECLEMMLWMSMSFCLQVGEALLLV